MYIKITALLSDLESLRICEMVVMKVVVLIILTYWYYVVPLIIFITNNCH